MLIDVISYSAIAQHHPRIENFVRSEKLAVGAVQVMYQDHIGYMWFGTDIGLKRYDGKSFSTTPNLGLPSDVISALTEDHRGILWVGSQIGISLIDVSTGNVTGQLRYNSRDPRHSLASNRIRTMLRTRAGDIWVGTDNGISVFSFTNGIPACNNILLTVAGSGPGKAYIKVKCLAEDRKGYIWAGTSEDDIWVIDSKSRKIIRHIDSRSLYKDESRAVIKQIFPEDDGTILVCTATGLKRISYDITDYSVKKVQIRIDNKPVTGLSINALIRRPDGYWLCTWGKGIIEGNFVSPLNDSRREADHFQGHIIYDRHPEIFDGPFEDREGGIWMGINTNTTDVLCYYHPLKQRFKWLDCSYPGMKRPPVVYNIYTDDNVHVFMGTSDGPFLYNDSTGTSVRISYIGDPSGHAKAVHVNCMYRDMGGELFCATNQGIKQIIKHRNTYYLVTPHTYPEWQEIATTSVKLMTSFNDSLLLFTTADHLYIWNRKSRKLALYSPQRDRHLSAGDQLITALHVDSHHNIWLGADFGISRYDPTTHTFRSYRWETGKPDWLQHSDIYAITDDGKYLWVSPYNGGFYRFDPKKQLFRYYTERDGLLGTSVGSMLPGKGNDLWISTEQGLSVFNTAKETFLNYGREECFSEYGFPVQVGCSRNGLLYFGSSGGVTRLNSDFSYNKYIPPVTITQVSVTDAKGRTSKLPLRENNSIVLTPDQKILSVEFAALSYVNPSRNKYAYRLEGLQNNWNQLGNQSSINLAGLAPGSYHLHIKASNNDGIWNNSGTTLLLRVMPRYWQTTWFWLAMAAIAMLVVYFLVKGYYLARLRKQTVDYEKQLAVYEERKRISRDMHDDLGSGLASMQLQIEGIRWKLEKDGTSGELTRVSQLVRQLVDGMREIVWALDPDDDTLASTLLFMRRYFLNIMGKANIQARILYPDELPEAALPAKVRRNLFLCVKEAVNNVIKHSAATVATLQVNISNDKLSVTVSDNGSFNPGFRDSFSHGLKNMQQRMESIGGTCGIKFGNNGTVIHFEIRISELTI